MHRWIVAIVLASVGICSAAEWRVNSIIGRNPNRPAISLPNQLEMQFTPGTKPRKQGLGANTRVEAYAAYRVKTDAQRLRSILLRYAFLLREPNGRVYIKRGYAYRTEESVKDINRMRETAIQGFKVKPNTTVEGFRFALFHRNNLEAESAWISDNMKAKGYAERWYEE
jgi:hypothetical protein